MGKDVTSNVIRVRENIKLGQRIEQFGLDSWQDGTWRPPTERASVGACRWTRINHEVSATKAQPRIIRRPVCPALSDFGHFEEPKA